MEVYFCFHEGVNHSGEELMEFLRIPSTDGGILVVSRKCHDWYQAARKWLWNIFTFLLWLATIVTQKVHIALV